MVQPLAPDLPELLDSLAVVDIPFFVLDGERRVRWANEAALRLLGSDGVAALANTGVAGDASTTRLERGFVVRTAPLRRGDGEVHGVLAVALPFGSSPLTRRPEGAGQMVLTPRQLDVLRLLSTGMSTEAIAARLGVAVETARNHIRALLRRLEVHSRLEAVVEARRRGLLPD
jgi:DNA-binding CsgD family transcriptional regulator